MQTIKLNKVVVFGENQTSKYWREIECAPQGRAYQKKKRSNHVTIIVDNKNNN